MTTEPAVIRDGARPYTEDTPDTEDTEDTGAGRPAPPPRSRPAGGPMLRSTLGILTAAAADPWGHGIEALVSGAGVPQEQDGSARTMALPRLSGFVESVFSPLAYEVSRRCLTDRPGDGARTAVVLASLMGDTTTFDLASRRMVAGRVHNPLLFMQSTANAVLGYLGQEFGITAQTLSLSTLGDPAAELLAMADLLLEDPELDRVLVVGVELSSNERAAAAHRELAAATGRPQPPATADLAVALLVGRHEPGQGPGAAAVSIRSAADPTGDAEARACPGFSDGSRSMARRLRTQGGEERRCGASPTDDNAGDGGARPRPPGRKPGTGPQTPDGTPDGTPEEAGPCGSLRGLLEVAAAYERLRRGGGSWVLVTGPASRSGAAVLTLTATANARPGGPPEENHDQ